MPIVLLALIPALAIDTSDLVEFEVEADVLLEPQRASSEGTPSNIYRGGDGPTILAIETNTIATRQSLAEAGFSTSFDLSPSNRAPLIDINLTAPTAAEATASGDALIIEMGEILRSSQADLGIPEDEMVQLRVLNPPNTAEQTSSGTVVLLVSLALGLVAGLVAAVLVDDAMRRRAARSGRRSASNESDGPDTKNKGHNDRGALIEPNP